jgi:hypothetical protein
MFLAPADADRHFRRSEKVIKVQLGIDGMQFADGRAAIGSSNPFWCQRGQLG